MSDLRKPILILKDIHKSFGAVVALKGVCGEIRERELVTFVGPSGCGKTTLLRVICGLTKPDSGEVILDGQVINDLTPDKRGTQMCFQNYALFPHLTVAGNIGYGLEVHKWDKKRVKERVKEVLHLVQLDGLGDRSIEKLSGGQQQRVALARALALNPKVLLLDEPLSNLDANLRVQMRATLTEIQKQVNITTVFVTHDQFEAMSISDRIFVLNSGIVEQAGSPIEIYEKPNSQFIAGFVGYVNILEGVVKSIGEETEPATVSTELGNLEVLTNEKNMKVGQKIFLVIRPETIRIDSFGKTIEANEFMGTIKNVMYTGSMVKYSVDIQGKQVVIDQFDPITLGIHGIGDKCTVILPQKVHILMK